MVLHLLVGLVIAFVWVCDVVVGCLLGVLITAFCLFCLFTLIGLFVTGELVCTCVLLVALLV